MSPQVLSPLSSQRDSFQYKSKHVTLLHKFQWLPITLSLYPKSLPWSHFWLFLRHFSLPTHHTHWVCFTLAVSSVKNAFPSGHHKAQSYTSCGSLLRLSLGGEAFLKHYSFCLFSSLPCYLLLLLYFLFLPCPPAPPFRTGFKWFIWVSIFCLLF